MPSAVTIIKDEHRAVGSVLRGLSHLVEEIRGGQPPDFKLLRAIVRYIEAFPDRLHHPKEDDYLYKVLRQRAPEVSSVLDALQDEHARGPGETQRLSHALDAYERDEALFESFAGAVSRYAEFQYAHMRKEEGEILPVAERALQPADWSQIDAAFSSNNDPIVGVPVQKEFRELFRKIVNLMPAPAGLGPTRR
jgi:hemerythrin-like domain-containing protein